MKKILTVISVLFVMCMTTSCWQKPFEPTISLSLNNDILDLPTSMSGSATATIKGNFHYIQITSTGSWEAIIETETGVPWCWLNDFYLKAVKDAQGNVLTDEFGETITERVYIAEGVEIFPGGSDTQFCKVKGKGTTFLPLLYQTGIGTPRYARFYVRREGSGEYREMVIKQAK